MTVAHSPQDVASWWGNGPLLAEALVPFTGEVAALLARSPSGEVASWPVASTVQVDGVCAEVTAPAVGIRPETAAEARRIGERIASELGVTGVLVPVKDRRLVIQQAPDDVAVIERNGLAEWLLNKPEELSEHRVITSYTIVSEVTGWGVLGDR